MMMIRHAARSLVSSSRQQEPITRTMMMMGKPRVMCHPRPLLGGCPAVAALSTTPLAPFKGPAFFRAYLQLLETHPVLTKSVTAATIFCLADATSQADYYQPSASEEQSHHVCSHLLPWHYTTLPEPRDEVQNVKTVYPVALLPSIYLRQGIKIALSREEDILDWDFARSLRMLAAGLLLSGPTLHFWFNLMSRSFPNRDIPSTLKKMALGQTVYGPIFNTVFFSLNAYLQGETTKEVISRLKRDLLPAIMNGLMYWPICDFLTYRYVPVHLQPLVNNSFAYVWTIYLTYMASLRKVFSVPCVEAE